MSIRILVVEDEVLVAEDIVEFLQELNYEVVGMAVSGEEAIEMALEFQPDLILMDIRLEGEIDGITAVVRIREQLDVSVVYLTAQWDKKTRDRAKEAGGAYGYVLKPWVERELEIGIEMALAIHSKEKQVKESEERVRCIVENALDAVVMMDSDGIIINWNPQAERTFGWSRDLALGQNLAELIIPPHLREAHERGLANFRMTHRGRLLNQRREFTALRRDGSQFPVELAVTSIKTGGQYVFSAFIRDITERKQSRERIEASERKYRTLVETTNTGFLILDEQGRVIDANAEYVRLSGHMTLQDIRGRRVLEWTAECLRDRHTEELRECFQSEKSRSFEILYGDAFGRLIPIEVNATRLQMNDGWRLLSLCRDITDRKRHQQELEEYAGAVSHELKRWVRSVRMKTQELDKNIREQLDGKDRKCLQTVFDSSGMLVQTIKAVQYNEELGRREVNAVDSGRVLANVLQILGPEIEAADAVLEMNPLPEVIAHEGELGMVFQNLISNAIKYRADHQLHILIESQRQGPHWRIAVHDNGIGIPPEKTSEVFEIFNRLKLKEGVEGQGIGLANCKKAIERRGGAIWIESELGKGSTFYFTLPAVDEADD